MSTLAYIGAIEEVPFFIDYFKRKVSSDTVCYAENAVILKQLKHFGIAALPITAGQILRNKQANWDNSWKWADSWGEDLNGGDLTRINGISIKEISKFWTSIFYFHFLMQSM